MTLQTTSNRAQYSGNDSTTIFAYTFKTNDDGDLQVIVADADDTQTTLTLSTHYTVSGEGEDSGGDVTLGDLTAICGTPELPTGWTVTILRTVEVKQLTDLQNQGGFFAEVHEDVFDYLTMINQQQEEVLNRCPKVSETSGLDGDDYLDNINTAVTNAEAAQAAAETAETNAETAQTAAELAETNAETAQTAAELAETNAEASEVAAELAETNAETAETAAELAETNAAASAVDALASEEAARLAETGAESAATAAGISATNASSSKDDAETAQTAAELAETNAAASAVDAAASAATIDLPAHVADTTPHATISAASIQAPSRLDAKQDTEANLTTYASTAADGQLCFATDTQKMYQVIDSALAEVGGGGSGDLHTYKTLVADDDAYTKWDTAGLTNATFGEESTAPLDGDVSYLFTNVTGSVGEFIYSEDVAVPERARGKTNGIPFPYKHDGDAGDFTVQVYDNTNTVLLGTALNVNSTTNGSLPVTVDIPSDCESIKLKVVVAVVNNGKEFIFDNLNFTDDPFVYKNLTEDVVFLATGNAGESLGSAATVPYATVVTDTHNGFNTTTDEYTIPHDGVYVITAAIRQNSVNNNYRLFVNGSIYKNYTVGGNTFQEFAQFNGKFVQGDVLKMTTGAAVTLTNSAAEHWFSITGKIETEHVVAPRSGQKQYSQANGDFTVTGTNWTTVAAVAVPYKTQDGAWRMKFNIDGTLSSTTTSLTLTISGVTNPAFSQALSLYLGEDGVNTRSPSLTLLTSGSSGQILLSARGAEAFDVIVVAGDVELASKPTWADDTTTNYLAAVPVDTYSARIDVTGSVASITSQGITGSPVLSVAHVGLGIINVTFKTGFFAKFPALSFSVRASAGSETVTYAKTSDTLIQVYTSNVGGAFVNVPFDIVFHVQQ